MYVRHLYLALDGSVGVHLEGVTSEVDFVRENDELYLQALFLCTPQKKRCRKKKKPQQKGKLPAKRQEKRRGEESDSGDVGGGDGID